MDGRGHLAVVQVGARPERDVRAGGGDDQRVRFLELAHAWSSDWRVTKLCTVITGSWTPGHPVERGQEPLIIGIIGEPSCHIARMSGVLSMSSRILAAVSIEGGWTLLDGVAGVLQRRGRLANPVLDLGGGALTGRVDHQGHPMIRLGGFGTGPRG